MIKNKLVVGVGSIFDENIAISIAEQKSNRGKKIIFFTNKDEVSQRIKVFSVGKQELIKQIEILDILEVAHASNGGIVIIPVEHERQIKKSENDIIDILSTFKDFVLIFENINLKESAIVSETISKIAIGNENQIFIRISSMQPKPVNAGQLWDVYSSI